MIATYPSFSKLNISHGPEVRSITNRFEPYSDFNFTSLFCWGIDKSAEISLLNNNLVIKLPDYISGQPIHSVLGDKSLDDTLVRLASDVGELKLVPEIVISKLSRANQLQIQPDEDNFDYIYLIKDHALLPGSKFKEKRKKTARFARTQELRYSVKFVNLTDISAADKIRQIFFAWAEAKDKSDTDTKQEQQALERLLQNATEFNIRAVLIELDEQPAGFSIHEVINGTYTISHFHKAVPAAENNLDVFLTQAAAKDLLSTGCTYDNWEQDLGLPALRASKLSYKPAGFLKKHLVKPAS